ncbi:hypothetical protein EVAR_51796_1 [Eumeta japonica]|uniref:Uncharacterized protein n=1 Tax=Eumeta variegata TaxID=151549 RepID=A0A4C2A6R2_EUMVA|nr:hypothetical protein EVAR_51796_1 [Eumeta japonica]
MGGMVIEREGMREKKEGERESPLVRPPQARRRAVSRFESEILVRQQYLRGRAAKAKMEKKKALRSGTNSLEIARLLICYHLKTFALVFYRLTAAMEYCGRCNNNV